MENTCYAARTLNDERAMSAFESVFKRYGKSVYKRVLDRTNNRGVAQEVVKEVFSDLYARMKKAPDADMTVLLIEAITDLADQLGRHASAFAGSIQADGV